MVRTSQAARPKKPKNKPYYPHKRGYWVFNWKGRKIRLGPWETPIGELDKIHAREVSRLTEEAKGNPTSRPMEDLLFADLVNIYLTERGKEVQEGELDDTTWANYKRTLEDVNRTIGGAVVAQLTTSDFNRVLEASKKYGTHCQRHAVSTTVALFAWAKANGYIAAEPVYGTRFRPPSSRRVRQERSSRQIKTFKPSEIRKLVAAADSRMRAMILLGINCAYLQIDLAELMIKFPPGETFNRVHLGADPYIRFRRPKTEAMRAATLWPETVDALRTVIADRTEGPVFITRKGQKLVHTHRVFEDGILMKATNCDAVTKPFRELCKRVGVYRESIGFSALRSTFETAAMQMQSISVADQTSIHVIMGHTVGSNPLTPKMADVYFRDVVLSTLRRVTDAMRDWYLTGE